MKFIERVNLDKLLNFETIFNKTKNAYILFSQGKTITPPFTVFTIPENNGSIHFKCGYVPNEPYFAMKYSGVFYGNEKYGLSNFMGLFTIFNSTTGAVEAVINDEGYLTDYRTGIAGAIATSTLANPDSETVAIIGTGIQARMQLHSILRVMKNIKNIHVYGRTKSKVSKYVTEMKSLYQNLNFIEFSDIESAVKNADIIYTVTYSESPILKSDWIKQGAHITAVGACEPTMQELDENIFKLADIVCVDSIESCSANGDLHHAINKGYISKDKVVELGTILKNKINRPKNFITVCDLVGLGFQDTVIGSAVIQEFNNNNHK